MSDDWSVVISLDGVLINLKPCFAGLFDLGGEADWTVLLMVV